MGSKIINIIELIIIVALAVTLAISVSKCSSYHDRYDKGEAALRMLDDSLYEYRNKFNEEYSLRKSYIADIEMLEKYNKELAAEVKSLKDNPLVVIKTEVEYFSDTIVMDSDGMEEIMTGIYRSDWSYGDKWFSLDGTSIFDAANEWSQTTVNDISVRMDLTTSLIEKDGNFNIIAKSSNPHVTINDIGGGMISPEKSKSLESYFRKRNHIGVTCGVGLIGGYGLGMSGTNVIGTPTVGVGVFVGIGYTRSFKSW